MRPKLIACWVVSTLVASAVAEVEAGTQRPNVIFILADDLGYADLGCYGQEKIQTPHLDRLAAEGIRFTQGYCGTSVCAASRCSLMTGLHAGHAHVRANRGKGNEGEEPLPEGTYTVASMLQQAGYRTACIGKWGLGGPESSGAPNRQGFDYFFGYTSHGQAHEYYPDHLWRNSTRIELDGQAYSHDLFVGEALAWVEQHRNQPFFLYLPLTIPHAKLQVPDLGAYADKPWSPQAKAMAAMITRMDRDVGRLIERLKALGIDERTVVFFAGDNGPDRGGIRAFFKASGSLRGAKRGMYEGGLRVPIIARWPKHAPAGKVIDEPWAFWDLLPTCAELAGADLPAGVRTDGLSIVPALRGEPMPARDYFYWEIHEPWSSRAVRFGSTKAVRPDWDAPVEIYDLAVDAGELHNLSGQRPDLVERAEQLFRTAREDAPLWPIKHRPPASAPSGTAAKALPPVVGAIRWDAWHGDRGVPGRAVEKSLGPAHWHDRLPFFARVFGPDRVEVRGDRQEVVDREIAYAASGGLDYWAFCYYPTSAAMNYGLDLYLGSERRQQLRFCLLLQSGHLATDATWPGLRDQLVAWFREPTYQRVLGDRPLLYLYLNAPDGLQRRFGSIENARRAFDEVREAARTAGAGDPYCVLLSWTPTIAAEQMRAIGFDAIGAYATAGGGPGRQPYEVLARHTRRFWEQCRATGVCVVPIVMAGWDRRPRVENPVPWEKPREGETVETALHFVAPQPEELAGLLSDAVQWNRNHRQVSPGQAVLIYAWNENDEGGWLVPTLSEGDARLRAVGAVLAGLRRGDDADSRPAPVR